ncbi:MAG TPA: formate dehydrogenase accessory sulfurtransferase FdhD, partial [Chloroflexota bacterium]|nr:formate dehydrogenase accessory sulfurtransferase FdhD [Chloroflexota bacterium]
MYRSPHDPERIITTRVRRVRGARQTEVDDTLAVEEPLEIFAGGAPLAVIMRTPGHDEELAAGFLHGEGLLADRSHLLSLRVWRDADGVLAQNRVTVEWKGS